MVGLGDLKAMFHFDAEMAVKTPDQRHHTVRKKVHFAQMIVNLWVVMKGF
jgi:hypothetical protein